MEDDQQFCLRWNNHQSTLIQNFDTLLESGTLVDCTLAAEGKTLKAHKVVLSACSPYFECLLSEHYDKHPVFILKDVKFKELKAMMDYMYRGEVNISQDQLAALLKAAESLQIKGLSESKTAGSSKTESRPQKTVSQPTAPSLDIPHASSGLTIEKNKVPRQSLTQSCVGDIPEDTASPQVSKGLSSREGSQSPTSRKRKRIRRRSLTDDSTIENQDASNSSDIPQQMGVPALGIAPVADEKVHADPTDSLGRSALMTQLTKPADEMLQLPLEKPEPNDNLIEPKSEYLDDAEEGVEDLTLDDDMNDLNDMEQDNNRAGPSHDSAQHPAAGLGSWHVTGDRSNAGGVVGSVVGGPGTADEVFLAAQEGVQRDSQGVVSCQEKQNPDYSIALEQHLGCLHVPSLQSYDSTGFGDSNTFGSDWYPENATKQQQQREEGHRRYLCPKCGNSYKYLGDMKKHMRFQCGQEPKFECPYCRKRSKVSSNMYAHVRTMHGDQPIYIIDLSKQSTLQ
ncbi:longitudinals lacking protein, isoforms A/B/D/L-like isoform X4 [Temnothorax curvispinosus]|uniref:Longitudinals lacking protein, isoforms A/B/D/L-like isoform X4 n=1 Tax=Temnothorax curvispinosus TaxID=300111 RepID=A0A6J1Q1R2_9HYME|nr:longitudinals lacking protein, isoforms A/B/D/L-like isoform X4 [Temnothorax curvispinosus]